jgi:protein-S-isoprenylcysteine O-methyltransferase Ste14
LIGGIGFALAVAGLGLGLQATRRSAAWAAVLVSALGVVFWAVHAFYFVQILRAWLLSLIAFGLFIAYSVFFVLAIAAWREMRRSPPPAGHEVLPPGYKVPYSWYHEDPPEVRLARELEQRRERLAVQQKELEMLEEKMKKKM